MVGSRFIVAVPTSTTCNESFNVRFRLHIKKARSHGPCFFSLGRGLLPFFAVPNERHRPSHRAMQKVFAKSALGKIEAQSQFQVGKDLWDCEKIFPERRPKMNDFKKMKLDSWCPVKSPTDLELAELLYEAKKFGSWRLQGYKKFSDYYAIALNVKPRKAQVLIHIYKKLVIEYSIEKNRLAILPWSKLAIICRAKNLDRDFVCNRLEDLCTLTQRGLIQFLKWYCKNDVVGQN